MNITGNALTTPADETIYGAFGEFETFAGPDTDEEWAQYDEDFRADYEAHDAAMADEYVDLDMWGADR